MTAFSIWADSSKERSWADVFQFEASAKGETGLYQQAVERNREIYEAIRPEQYRTIRQCAEHAVAEGHHGAFVHFYLDHTKTADQLCGSLLRQYLCESEPGGNGQQIAQLSRRLLFMKRTVWQSVDAVLDEKALAEPGYFYTASSVANWFRSQKDIYWSKPPREVLIQLGFYLGLGSEQVHELLQKSGFQGLYAFHPIDAVCIYYLDEWAGDDVQLIPVYRENKVYYVTEKLRLVREKIRELLGEMPAGDGFLYETEQIRCRDGQIQKLHVLQLTSKMLEYREEKWNIEQEMETLSRMTKTDGRARPMYPTLYMREQIAQEGPAKWMSDCFTLKRYGFLYVTLQLMTSGRYEKNCCISSYELTGKTRIEVVWDAHAHGCQEFRVGYRGSAGWREMEEGIGAQSCAGDLHQQTSLGTERQAERYVYQIGRQRNVVEETVPISPVRVSEFTELSQRLYGRKEHTSGDSTQKQVYYQFDIGHKEDIAQLVIATGNEDRLGEYLSLAGFWDGDLYLSQGNEQPTAAMEQLDCFLVYLLTYRDLLIQHWAEEYFRSAVRRQAHGTVSEVFLREKIRREFPLIRLAMTINRDIMFVMDAFDTAEERNKRERCCDRLEHMIFPVRESDRRWFAYYREQEFFHPDHGGLQKKKKS